MKECSFENQTFTFEEKMTFSNCTFSNCTFTVQQEIQGGIHASNQGDLNIGYAGGGGGDNAQFTDCVFKVGTGNDATDALLQEVAKKSLEELKRLQESLPSMIEAACP